MGLQPIITTAQSRDGLIIDVTDTTGAYNVTTNSIGYGTPRASGALGANAANDTFTLIAHGMVNNEVINFTSVGSLTGINLDQAYYVIYLNDDNFSISESINGSALDFGGTLGVADFQRGYKAASQVAKTIFQVEDYRDGTIRYSDYLDSGTFIPKGTTTDTTTVNSIVASGDSAAGVIADAVYGVTMIPIWSPAFTVNFISNFTAEITGVDLSGLYSNAGFIYISDGGLDYLFEISSITLVGGATQITIPDNTGFTGNSYSSGDWGLAIPATSYVNCIYNTYSCFQSEVTSVSVDDFSCVCSGGRPSDSYLNAQELNMVLISANANLYTGNYSAAENLIEYGVKMCTKINNDCGCH